MASPILDFLRQFGATRDVKASAIIAGIQALTGSAPNVRKARDDYGEYIEITPTEQQAEVLRRQLEAWLGKEPGDVRVNLTQIWWPVVMKKIGLWVAGGMAVSAYLGRKSA